MGILAGRTIVVTRSKSQAGPLVWALKKEKAKVVLCPAIQIVSLLATNPVRHFFQLWKKDSHTFDRVVFLSANAVRFFHQRWMRAGMQGPPPRIVAVGPETARAIQRSGWRVARIAKVHNARGVVRSLGRMHGERILIPRVRGGPEDIVHALQKHHAAVKVLSLYETKTAPLPNRALKKKIIQQADVILFTSPSTVRFFTRFFKPQERRHLFKRAKAICMGPSTLGALRKHGLTGTMAKHSTPVSLVKAAAQALRACS